MDYPKQYGPPMVVNHADATVNGQDMVERVDRTAVDRMQLQSIRNSLLTTMRTACAYLHPGTEQKGTGLPYVNEHVDVDPLRLAGWYAFFVCLYTKYGYVYTFNPMQDQDS